MTPWALAVAFAGCAPDANDQPPGCTGIGFFADADGDGHGDPHATIAACVAPDGYTAGSDDCDDGDAQIHPDADELCNGIDDDCDSLVDSLDPSLTQGSVFYVDADSDGFGDPATGAHSCEVPAGRIGRGEDCDDTNIAIHPDAAELCNETDDDCDGAIDDEPIDAVTFYADADGDGFGDAAIEVSACAPPSGYVSDGTDCDDGDALAGARLAYYDDDDGDGYGSGAATVTCAPGADQVLLDGDCHPSNPALSPGAPEVCNSYDDNCDGLVDEDDPGLVAQWFADDDGDLCGDPTDAITSCSDVWGFLGYVFSNSSDCDDTDAAINPRANEYCDGVDNDCDGSVEVSVVYVDWYADADGDGWGDPDDSTNDCVQPSGYVLSPRDCDDTVATTYPGSPEVCGNGADDNCNGVTDNCVLGYADLFDFVIGLWWPMGERLAVADANGDELADLVVSEPDYEEIGSAFIAVGLASGATSFSDLLELQGTTESSQFGTGFGGGDVNVDEVDDILVGAPGSGAAYLFLGPVTADRAATDADTIFEANSAGSDVDAVDYDADGSPDVAVGACCDSTYAGAVYLAVGPVSADVDLGADATWVFAGPSADDQVGNQVVDAGDMNGDGIHDLAIGAESGNGTVYVVDGGMAAGAYSIDLVASVAIEGPELDSYFGSGLVTPDYDGDGTIDVVVGAFQANPLPTGDQGGGVYAFLGPLPGALDVSAADATWLGGLEVESLGMGVAAGDIDADGSTDLALGAPGDLYTPGAVYFQLGLASGTVDVSTLPSVLGDWGDLAGYSIALVPDWTGDGGAEIAFGVPGYDDYGDNPGGGFALLLSEELY